MFTGGYNWLQEVTGGDEGVQGVTKFYMWLQRVLQEVTGGYRWLQIVTGGYKVSRGLQGVTRNPYCNPKGPKGTAWLRLAK